jgi:hydrogenase maturation protease
MSIAAAGALDQQGPDRSRERPAAEGAADSAADQRPTVPGKPTPAPLRALVIGYGSPIRGDDALGPLVADRLETRLAADPRRSGGIEVQARHILTAEIVDDLVRAARAIFIDAAADLEPGEVRCRRLAPDTATLSTMAHFHDPRELLAWCEALYQRAPETWLVSAGGADWGYANYRLSATAEQAVEPMLSEVLTLIAAAPEPHNR